MSTNDSLGLKAHIRVGIFYGTLAGVVQGLAEAFILSIRYNGYIFGPQDIYKSQVFSLISKILHLDKNESIQFILDRYLGPNFMDKIPLIYDLTVVYAIVGLIGGACAGIFLWSAFKFVERSLDTKRLSVFYLSFLLCFGIFINLIIWLNGKYIIKTFAISGLLTDLGLVAAALLFVGPIYKLGCTLIRKKSLESNKTISSEIFIAGSKIVLLSVGLVIGVALVLNLGALREGKRTSEIFADQIRHNTANRLTNLADKSVNVILISIDSLRADHLSCYGYPRKTGPNIDKLASEGVIVSEASSTTSWTLPAHMSMLTSMYPEAHGVITDKDYLDENRVTLAEVLRKEKYATAAFVSGPYLSSRYGFNRGFDLYDDFTINFDSHNESHQGITSPKLNEAIQSWLRKNYEKKFFLFLHYWDVHYDYIPPPPYDTMFDPDYKGTIDAQNYEFNYRIRRGMDPRDLFHIIALYDGEIALTDRYIGELLSALKELGIFNRTLIVLTADHGDEFYEHGRKGHMRTLYEEVLHVPLIFKFPSNSNLVGDRKVKEVVSIIDIVPTILEYISVKPNEEMQGRSLLHLLNGNNKSNDVLIYSSLLYKLATVRSADSKLIHYFEVPKKEFFDLVNDSQEKINLFDKRTSKNIAEEESYLISLLNWLNAQRQFHRALPKTATKNEVELSEPMKEQLKSLGYMQ